MCFSPFTFVPAGTGEFKSECSMISHQLSHARQGERGVFEFELTSVGFCAEYVRAKFLRESIK